MGGAVRDFLLDRSTKDVDFLIRKVPIVSLNHFLNQHGKANFVGKNFGVYKFIPTGTTDEIDVALPRTERSFTYQGGYRDFEVETNSDLSVLEDLKRRDFTINAMALDMKRFCLIDPFDGLNDLAQGRLRAVGTPEIRFSEDYSRLLRGLRFSCQFDFEFDPETKKALFERIGFLNAKREDGTFVVPRETIAKEFLKALCCHPVRMFDLWDESGAFAELIPELLKMKDTPQPPQFHSEGDVWAHTRLALSQLTSLAFCEEFQTEFNAEVALAVLLHDVAKPVTIKTPERDGTDRIRFDNHDHVGAAMAREIIKRLKLASLPKSSRYAINEDAVSWLIEKHLILVCGDADKMRASTIEKYFLDPKVPGPSLMRLIFCDGNAAIPADDPLPKMRHYQQLKNRLEKMKQLRKESGKAIVPFLSGHEIISLFGIKTGPEVGQYLALLREEQLSERITNRDEAIAFLRQRAATTS